MISGRVQGVSFRYTIKRLINDKFPHIHGMVRNLVNGDVELVANLNSQEVEQIEKLCRTGVRMARVDSVLITQIEEALELPCPFAIYPNWP